jgi:polyisoprenoid-binding protein YceI
MMRTVMTVLALGLATAVAYAADPKAPPAAPPPPAVTTYALSGDNTKLTFVGTKTEGKHEGGFKTLKGMATVGGSDLANLKIEIDIDCDSLYSDDAKLTTHLKSPDFFGTKDNPKATFKTKTVTKGDKVYTIAGELTMLGKTKPVTFPASISVTGDVLSLSTEFKIDRTDWGMAFGKGKIDDKVTLKIAVTAKK